VDPNPNGGREIEDRVSRDTKMLRSRACRARGARALVALITSLLAWPQPSHGAVSKDALRHRFLWGRGSHAYVALSDTSRAAEDDSVRFEDRRRLIAGGRIRSIVHGEMAIVSLTSGSLDRVQRPERIVVTTTRSAVVAPRSLRIALPADDRDNLLFRCSAVTPRLPPEAPRYRSEPVDQREVRLVREDGASHGAPWPDTLIVLLFRDPADEEIALERGDVDVAVFWPGELSRRLRNDARWSGQFGITSRGVLALVGAEGMSDASPDTAWVSAFNEELFRGDLGLRGLQPYQPWITSSLYRLEADPALPGREPIGQWLTRHSANPTVSVSLPRGAKPPRARMAFVDAPSDTASAEGFIPLLQLRLPVLSGLAFGPVVRALGADALANLATCSGTTTR